MDSSAASDRGGVVTAMQIKLQMIARNQVAITKLKKIYSLEEMTQAFVEDHERMVPESAITNTAPMHLALVGLIGAKFDTFFMLEKDLVNPTYEKDSFPLYGPTDWKVVLLQKAAHALRILADWVATKYLDMRCAKTPCEFFSGDVTGTSEFHDQPLDNYIFFQDSFARNIVESDPKDYQTSHFTLMLRLENLKRATEAISIIKNQPEYEDIHFELQDLLPLPSTRVLMSPPTRPSATMTCISLIP